MLNRLSSIRERYEELNRLLSDPNVVTDFMKVQRYSREQSSIKHVVELAQKYQKLLTEIDVIKDMIKIESDPELVKMAREEENVLLSRFSEVEIDLKLALVPKDPNDEKNVIMEIRAGTGGEEAGLFASELYRMYSRFSQRMKWRISVINSNANGIGSIKEITFQIEGANAYSQLKHESGVHRVQRVPITESSGRILTSAASGVE